MASRDWLEQPKSDRVERRLGYAASFYYPHGVSDVAWIGCSKFALELYGSRVILDLSCASISR